MKQLSEPDRYRGNSDRQGYTLTTSDGSPLVVAGQSYTLQTSADATGCSTFTLRAGHHQHYTGRADQAGFITVRDQVIPQVVSSLNDLAGGLATNFNAAHQGGFDLAGNAGQNFFGAATGAGAAANFSVQITDPT